MRSLVKGFFEPAEEICAEAEATERRRVGRLAKSAEGQRVLHGLSKPNRRWRTIAIPPRVKSAIEGGSGTAIEETSIRNARGYGSSGPAPSGSKSPMPVTQLVSLMPRASRSVHPLFGSIRVLRSIGTASRFHSAAQSSRPPAPTDFWFNPTAMPALLIA